MPSGHAWKQDLGVACSRAPVPADTIYQCTPTKYLFSQARDGHSIYDRLFLFDSAIQV